MEPVEETTFIVIIEILGTISFAISGIRLAAAKISTGSAHTS